jgi:hypothetical protein
MSAQFNSGIYVLVEAVVVFGLALVFGIRELRNLRRFDREREARNNAEAERNHPKGE